MAHESFEDPETAALMNELFVNVKVDREERPDVDAVYMQAVQALTGRGGWPMSVWCTPTAARSTAARTSRTRNGTACRRSSACAKPSRKRGHERRDEVLEHAGQLTEAIDEQVMRPETRVELSRQLLREAYDNIAAQFEPQYGGFGTAPKFPPAMTLEFLCRSYQRNESEHTLEMITTTLDAMAAGGIYDQIGGGFARYSTDDYWLVPHFEKMLYDNALLTRAYLHAYLLTGEPRYRRIVEETIEYVLRDLRHPEGGFFSAEDADSEGDRGQVLPVDARRDPRGLRRRRRGSDRVLRRDGRRELRRPAHAVLGQHPARRRPAPRAVGSGAARPRAPARPGASRRIRPGLDNKVLLGWNALFLGALTEAAAALDRDDWMGGRPRQRPVPPHAAPPRGRAAAALVAGAVPRVRRGLRRAARSAVHAGRARRRVVARLRPRRSPTT